MARGDCLISAATRVVGVLGWPVAHSLSPPMHNAAFREAGLDFVYVAFAVPPEQLERATAGLRALNLVGANVTIPHKEAMASLVDELDPLAAAGGTVNTVHHVGGRLKGYSTDGPGLLRSLAEAGVLVAGKRIALIGAGGSARATGLAMVEAGAASLGVINRTPERAQRLAHDLNEYARREVACATGLDTRTAEEWVRSAEIVADSTDVGMHPRVDVPPVIPPEWIGPDQAVVDYTYNPPDTVLLRAARTRGAQTVTGIGMLVHQGALAWELWTGQPAPVEVMRRALLEALEAVAR